MEFANESFKQKIMRTTILTAALALFLGMASKGFAQGSNNEFPWQISDFSLSVGEVLGNRTLLTPEQARAKFPNSALLQNDYSDYNVYSGRIRFGIADQAVAQVSVGFRKNSPDQSWLSRKSSFRVGAMVMGLRPENGYWYRSTSGPFDTLTSSATGQQIFIDSVQVSTVDYYNNQTQIHLTAAWMLDLIRSAKWNIQVGVAASAGVAADNYSEVYRNDYTTYQQNYSQSTQQSAVYYYSHGSDFNYDYNRSFFKPSVAGSISVPVSVCFNLGKGLADKYQLGVTYDAKPSVMVGGRSNPTVSYIHQAGLRLTFPDKGI